MRHGPSRRELLCGALSMAAVTGLEPGTAEATHVAAPKGVDGRPFRILHVMSFHSPWRWTDGQFGAFRAALDLDATYRVVQLDAKRNTDIGTAVDEARRLIDTWKPDLVYVTDDDAQQLLTRDYIGSDLPFVFSGVGAAPDAYGFDIAPNVTGVREEEHFVQSVRLLRMMVPTVRRIAVVFDGDPVWRPIRRRMEEGVKDLGDLEIVAADDITRFADYQERLAGYAKIADAVAPLGVFHFADAQGANVPFREVLRWTAENSPLPDFAFWIDRVHHGTLCAVAVSEQRQGMAAGRLARAILHDGVAPTALPIETTHEGLPAISLARARRLGLRIDSGLLLRSQVITQFAWAG